MSSDFVSDLLDTCIRKAMLIKSSISHDLPPVLLVLSGSPASHEVTPMPLPSLAESLRQAGVPEALARQVIDEGKMDDKDCWQLFIQTVMAEPGSFAYVMVTEAWSSMLRPGVDPSLVTAFRPSEAPEELFEKAEILHAVFCGLGVTAMAHVEIKPSGGFGEIEHHGERDGASISGRFVGLVDDRSGDAN